MNKEEVVKLAKEHGMLCNDDDELLAFANACEKIGMEKAAKICERASKVSAWDVGKSVQEHCADAIRAHKE